MNKRKGAISQQTLAVSRQEWIQKIKLFECYTGKDKKNWTYLSLLGQEPTFKIISSDPVMSTALLNENWQTAQTRHLIGVYIQCRLRSDAMSALLNK